MTPYSIGYGYDADNRQTHVTYPDGSVVARNFTDRNQLDVVTFNNALVANFDYDNAGRKVSANFGNGITETRTYQADNLNTSINTPGVTAFGYTWDANKRKLSQTETGIPTNNQVYTYDNEDRLTGFNRNNGDTQAWTLSLVGDWNQFNNNGNVENRTHNAVHEITTIDATPLVHDLKGNLTTNKNGQVYAWDIENRLQFATVPAGCPEGVTGTHSYTYDALGRRVSKTVGGNTTVFISDGMQEIAEYVNGTFSQSYVYGSYIDEPLLKTDSAGNKIYYHTNNLFSVAALTDNVGTVVERYKYDPYGKATVLAADGVTVRAQSQHGNPWQDRGRRLDLETGLQHYRNRMWDMSLGRFANRDPLGYVDGYNMYQGYFIPNGMDPLGLGWGDDFLNWIADTVLDPHVPPLPVAALEIAAKPLAPFADAAIQTGVETLASMPFVGCDSVGQIFLMHWLRGGGRPLELKGNAMRDYLSPWGAMKLDIADALIKDKNSRCAKAKAACKGVTFEESKTEANVGGELSLKFPTSLGADGLSDSYQKGWGMLNGTNPNFEIKGFADVSYNCACDCCEIAYDLTFIWHDIIDPNLNHYGDKLLAGALPNGKDYKVEISWDGNPVWDCKKGFSNWPWR
jgi:RHS repeat-associated protein